MDTRIAVRGADVLARLFTQTAGRAGPAVASVVHTHAMLLETKIKANASGRPGPNAPTGDYRRSWTTELRGGAGGPEAIVGTSKPQGRRLEFGFVGVDSLGRHYNQPPYPHVGPAMGQIEPQFHRALDRLVTRLLAGGRG